MNEIKLGRRERRRKKVEMQMEGNQLTGNEFQTSIENSELKAHVTHSLKKLVRRDTYTVSHSKSDFDMSSMEEVDEDFNAKSEGSRNNSIESKNLTYSLNKGSNSFEHCTYSIDKVSEIPPVPAPRKRKSRLETEKLSSDTDRDITEIDLDDIKSPKPENNLNSSPISTKSPNFEELNFNRSINLTTPIPKPRKTVKTFQKGETASWRSENEVQKSPESSKTSKAEDFIEKNPKSGIESQKTVKDSAVPPESNELPLVTDLQEEVKSVREKSRKQKKLIGELMGRKKKSKTFSSLMKLEKKKIPKISSILKDLKEEDSKEIKAEGEDSKTDLQIDSPHYPESAQNGRIYVQGKNGFHLMERDEVLGTGKGRGETDGNGGRMEDSTVKTAVLFQKYSSRLMTYFHGVLGGLGFCHAAAVTVIMLHFNYQPQQFIAAYSCLSLKTHYVFYTLITLCIVSCFDRVDLGHMNRRHWEKAWKLPSIWVVTLTYIVSIALTFSNQKTEARFDALPDGNETEIWDGQSQREIQLHVLQWYHTVWARDALVLLAWFVISLTKFQDFLHSHISNMAKYANANEEKGSRHKTDFF